MDEHTSAYIGPSMTFGDERLHLVIGNVASHLLFHDPCFPLTESHLVSAHILIGFLRTSGLIKTFEMEIVKGECLCCSSSQGD